MKNDMENMMDYLNEIRNPINHLPTNLGVKEFKKVVRSTSLPKNAQNKLIRAYKRRSWMEFQSITRMRGTWSSHPAYGRRIEVNTEETKEYKVTVNEKQPT